MTSAPAPFGPVTPAEDSSQARTAPACREQELVALRAGLEEVRRALSHDLRAPVRHVMSYAPLLRETLQDAGLQGAYAQEAAQFLGVMEQAARRLGSMLDGTLRVMRVLEHPPRLQRVDLVQLFDAVRMALLAADPQGEVATVEWQLPPAPVYLQADPELLREMLQALLDNAIKFSRGRHPARVTLATEPLPQGGLRWQVQDNGAGCDSRRAALAFGLFQRLHREGEFAGEGVGLAVAQAVACQHGASLALHAEPDQGCTLVVDWPAQPLQA